MLLGAEVTAGLVWPTILRARGGGQPSLLAPTTVLDEARATTHRVARTFSIACRLLPRDVRDDVYRLYLVFRSLDDLVDDEDPEAAGASPPSPPGPRRPRAARTREVACSRTSPPATRCRARRWPTSARDARRPRRRPAATEEDLDRYCYRVAGTVGLVDGLAARPTDDARARPAAAALGMAMQRTNILRDLDEDGAAGPRLPGRERPTASAARWPGEREALLRDQIARADALYEQGLRRHRAASARPPRHRGRRHMYREILRQIEREGYGARAGRAVVGRRASSGWRAAFAFARLTGMEGSCSTAPA